MSIFKREIFFPFLFFPDFEPCLGLFVFIFNAFFMAGIPETVLVLVAYILSWHSAAQKLVLSSSHRKIFAFVFLIRHFKTSIF